jgi:hypothetical protein
LHHSFELDLQIAITDALPRLQSHQAVIIAH